VHDPTVPPTDPASAPAPAPHRERANDPRPDEPAPDPTADDPAPDPAADDPADGTPLIRVRAWPDQVVDTLGYDPCSLYVETFWLPTLGPTSLLLLRHCARALERTDEVVLTVGETSRALGLGDRTGLTSPLLRAFARLCQFDLATSRGPGEVAVRTTIPPVNRRHTRRLPQSLQTDVAAWQLTAATSAPLTHIRRRARRTAFTLLELGDDVDVAERMLHRLGFHPAVCREAAEWAAARHHEAARAAADELERPLAAPDDAAIGGTAPAPREPVPRAPAAAARAAAAAAAESGATLRTIGPRRIPPPPPRPSRPDDAGTSSSGRPSPVPAA
jgi:hypothetical protein